MKKSSAILSCLLVTLFLSRPLPAQTPGKELDLDLGNKLTLKMVLIPAGKFIMGSPDKETGHHPNESPQHEVTISKPFYMSIYVVTQEQYEAVMGAGVNPSKDKGPSLPLMPMTYKDITDFCDRLTAKFGHKFRVPTEAEWEYACRAGTTTTWFWGDDPKLADDYGWFHVGHDLHPPGLKKPNPWGLYDMVGSCGEVCSDMVGMYPAPSLSNYTADPVTDPTGPTNGIYHAARAQGGWCGNSRSAGFREAFAHPEFGDHGFSIRLVAEAAKP